MNTQEQQAKIDRRIALSMKCGDEWDEINYPDLTPEQNTDIRVARRLGYAMFYPNTLPGEVTLKGARKYLKSHL